MHVCLHRSQAGAGTRNSRTSVASLHAGPVHISVLGESAWLRAVLGVCPRIVVSD